VFLPVLEEFEKRRQRLRYPTSSRDDPVFESRFQYITPEFIGEGNRPFARLNLLDADFALMTTPGLGIYQMKRSCHVFHGPTDPRTYRMFGLDYFD
jgi:hypothetical protein